MQNTYILTIHSLGYLKCLKACKVNQVFFFIIEVEGTLSLIVDRFSLLIYLLLLRLAQRCSVKKCP